MHKYRTVKWNENHGWEGFVINSHKSLLSWKRWFFVHKKWGNGSTLDEWENDHPDIE